MNPLVAEELIVNFLNEDLGITGDWSALPLQGKRAKAQLLSRERAVLCGAPFFEKFFKLLDPSASFDWRFKEGEELTEEVVCSLEADAAALLAAERSALNLLQRLSGIATKTKEFVKVLEGSPIKLLDTRKSTPGLRIFEKYATRVGGAKNHRIALFDAVMVKDNHIKAYGSIKRAVEAIRETAPITLKIEVEVENWAQLEEALEVRELIEIIMLDNWKISEVGEAARAIKRASSKLKIELSGGITKEKLKEIRELPIDFVSTSRIITQAGWIDLSLEVV